MLPLGILNKRSISYLAAAIPFSIKIGNKLEKAAPIGSYGPLEEVSGPETGQKTTFSWKMTHVPSIGIIMRS